MGGFHTNDERACREGELPLVPGLVRGGDSQRVIGVERAKRALRDQGAALFRVNPSVAVAALMLFIKIDPNRSGICRGSLGKQSQNSKQIIRNFTGSCCRRALPPAFGVERSPGRSRGRTAQSLHAVASAFQRPTCAVPTAVLMKNSSF